MCRHQHIALQPYGMKIANLSLLFWPKRTPLLGNPVRQTFLVTTTLKRALLHNPPGLMFLSVVLPQAYTYLATQSTRINFLAVVLLHRRPWTLIHNPLGLTFLAVIRPQTHIDLALQPPGIL
jgi:hypothetical protein